MINEIILNKIKGNKDSGTLLTILFGLEQGCNFKMFKDCAPEFKTLRDMQLIKVNEENELIPSLPLFSDMVELPPRKSIGNFKFPELNKDDVNVWIDEWLALFPTDLMSKGILTYSVSGNKAACITRMKRFLREHKNYDKEIIMKATQRYLDYQKQKNWQYTKKNSKFIYDNDGSILEQFCEDVVNNPQVIKRSTGFSL